MAQKKQDQEGDAHGVQSMNWDQRYEELGDAIFLAKMDASNVVLLYDDEKLIKHHLKQAAEHLAFAKSEPDKREEHIQAGFDYVGGARGILGESPVQSHSFRRYQWPFLSPGMD